MLTLHNANLCAILTDLKNSWSLIYGLVLMNFLLAFATKTVPYRSLHQLSARTFAKRVKPPQIISEDDKNAKLHADSLRSFYKYFKHNKYQLITKTTMSNCLRVAFRA